MDDYDTAARRPRAHHVLERDATPPTYSSAQVVHPGDPVERLLREQAHLHARGVSRGPTAARASATARTGKADFLHHGRRQRRPERVLGAALVADGRRRAAHRAPAGKRYLPDVSLFAANGVWGHFYVYCMSDAAEGGRRRATTPTRPTPSTSAAGGTSFASPALAGIQALVNQKTGASQGNPNDTYYKLAADRVRRERRRRAATATGGSSRVPVAPRVELHLQRRHRGRHRRPLHRHGPTATATRSRAGRRSTARSPRRRAHSRRRTPRARAGTTRPASAP